MEWFIADIRDNGVVTGEEAAEERPVLIPKASC